MTRDKQLLGIKLATVRQKQKLDQALNAKEFSVLAGVSYSTARSWFRLPGFPVIGGVVFWVDFVAWRKQQTGLDRGADCSASNTSSAAETKTDFTKWQLPERAATLLREAAR